MISIKVGEFYKNRRGTKVGPILATKNTDFPFRVAGLQGGIFYTADGRTDPKKPAIADLIDLWFDPNAVPVAIADEEPSRISTLAFAERQAEKTPATEPKNQSDIEKADADRLARRADIRDKARVAASKMAERMTQVTRSTSNTTAKIMAEIAAVTETSVGGRVALAPELKAKLDARKKRGRPKGTPDKEKAAKTYAKVKKEMAEKLDMQTSALKMKMEAMTAIIDTATPDTDNLIINLTETIEQLARRAALRGRIDRTEAKFLGAVIYTATAIIFLRD